MAKYDAALAALALGIQECQGSVDMYQAIIANVTEMEEDPRLFTRWQIKVITAASLWRHHYQERIVDLEVERAKIKYTMRSREQKLRKALAQRAKLRAARRRAQEPTVRKVIAYPQMLDPVTRLATEPVTVQSSLGGADAPWQWSWAEGFVPFSDMLPIPGLSLFSSRPR